MLNKWLLHDC